MSESTYRLSANLPAATGRRLESTMTAAQCSKTSALVRAIDAYAALSVLADESGYVTLVDRNGEPAHLLLPEFGDR